MFNGEEKQSLNDLEMDDVEESVGGHAVEGTETDGAATEGGANRGSSGLAERLTEILVEDGDGDLLLQRSDREGSVLQWLQALDMQVMGACRADERLKPLLKMNVSTGAAEDCLLAYLSQHFDPAEVGMLARCLCIPLVSVRVGKIKKQGTQLCPTPIRGSLSLSLLPTSGLRISFIGDDGSTDRLATLCSILDCSTVEIEGISADQSGRSFLIKIPDGEIFYFWCSEKSKLLGDDMLRKMKDILKKKPSLGELTGIRESRLKCFAIHLRAHLVGSTLTNGHTNSMLSTTPLFDSSVDSSTSGPSAHPSASSQKSIRARHYSSQGSKTSPFHQGGLSPRSSSFKESLLKNSSSLKNVARDKLRRRGDSASSVDDGCIVRSLSMKNPSTSTCSNDKPSEETVLKLLRPTNVLESLAADTPFLGPAPTVPSLDSTLLSPYYCWCPPPVSALQYSVGTPQLPILSTEPFSLPPFSSLSIAKPSVLLAPKQPLNLADVSPLDLPPLLPDPLVRLPLTLPVSQQIPTFTPLICDPIVHIPFIDVCSSGQGYLVSAGPGMSTGIPPLHPNLVSPLIPEAESVVEKSARETLRLLMNSSNQPHAPLMSVLPSFLPSSEEKLSVLAGGSRGLYSGTIDIDVGGSRGLYSGTIDIDVGGSRGLYSGTIDIDVTTVSVAKISKRDIGEKHLVEATEMPSTSDGTMFGDDGFSHSEDGKSSA
ncbi:uncharacterized protein LOC116011890 [Ipomoea triloba]|uniref:uncharacterized protein LOC116011890 n=1 Tax=Ipomoea triloba TaxID=35885 RepID=UPI00125E9B7F|nr:uncharacterized protein LOC116011890 [Ipomoea triloba]